MSKDRKREPEWGEKSWWSRRSKLERKLLIALGILVVLVVGILIYNAIKLKKVSTTLDGCGSSECLQAAAQIVTHIDTSVDPCEDFFKFACGKFIEHIHGDIKATSIQNMEDQVQRQFDEIINGPADDEDHFAMKIDKKFFNACMNESAVEEESIDVFKEHLEELNGWPVVLGYRWKESVFHWTKWVVKLKEMGYPYSMMLDFTPVHDPLNKNRYILRISEPFVSVIKSEHKKLYKRYMTDVAMIFGASDRYRAGLEMEQVMVFKEKLKGVVDKSSWNVENNETDTNYTAKLIESRFSVKEFQDYNNEIDWLELINSIVSPVINITNDDYVIFPDSDFMDAFFILVHKTPRKIQANYIIWTVIERIMPFLTKQLKYLEGNYTCQVKETSSTPSDHSEFCKGLLKIHYFPQPASIMYARRYLPPEKRDAILELLENIKGEFRSLLETNAWMDDESKDKALDKFDDITEIIGAPGDYFDDGVFDRYDIYNQTHNGSFFDMVLERSKHENDVIFGLLEKQINESIISVYYHLITKVNAMYSPFDNSIILPVGILQGIFYNSNRPQYLNYGALGSIIGHELTHGFSQDASKYDKDGNEVNMWTNETEAAYGEVTQCVIQDAEEFNIEDTEMKINGTLTLEENVADFTGLKVAYAAYQKWVEENGEEAQLPGIEYTPNQLFWISAISYECYKLTGDKLEKGLKRDSHAHNAFRATAPMRNNEDFSKDFNCPVDSKMNPSEKCQVF